MINKLDQTFNRSRQVVEQVFQGASLEALKNQGFTSREISGSIKPIILSFAIKLIANNLNFSELDKSNTFYKSGDYDFKKIHDFVLSLIEENSQIALESIGQAHLNIPDILKELNIEKHGDRGFAEMPLFSAANSGLDFILAFIMFIQDRLPESQEIQDIGKAMENSLQAMYLLASQNIFNIGGDADYLRAESFVGRTNSINKIKKRMQDVLLNMGDFRIDEIAMKMKIFFKFRHKARYAAAEIEAIDEAKRSLKKEEFVAILAGLSPLTIYEEDMVEPTEVYLDIFKAGTIEELTELVEELWQFILGNKTLSDKYFQFDREIMAVKLIEEIDGSYKLLPKNVEIRAKISEDLARIRCDAMNTILDEDTINKLKDKMQLVGFNPKIMNGISFTVFLVLYLMSLSSKK